MESCPLGVAGDAPGSLRPCGPFKVGEIFLRVQAGAAYRSPSKVSCTRKGTRSGAFSPQTPSFGAFRSQNGAHQSSDCFRGDAVDQVCGERGRQGTGRRVG